MVATKKGPLSSSSSGACLFLFMGVALLLLLLPTAFGYKCKALKEEVNCTSTQDNCVKKWFPNGTAVALGCVSSRDSDFTPGCREKGGVFVCVCSFALGRQLCNRDNFGLDRYKTWKARQNDVGVRSEGNALSNLLQLTFAALLTLGVFLGR